MKLWEIFLALEEGKRVRSKSWREESYVQKQGEHFLGNHGERWCPDSYYLFEINDWELFEEKESVEAND